MSTPPHRVNQKLKFTVFVIALLCGLAVTTYFGVSRTSSKAEAQAERNKDIEIEAATERNPARCDEIQGASYIFGPRDERIEISESEARTNCRENIQRGIIPTRYGG